MDFYNYVGIKLAHEMLARCKQFVISKLHGDYLWVSLYISLWVMAGSSSVAVQSEQPLTLENATT